MVGTVDLNRQENDPKPVQSARLRDGMNDAETRYMRGGLEPVTSSVLISNSRYLNSPLYRDAYTQAGLRRIGNDLPFTYHVPWMSRAIADVTDFERYGQLVEAEKDKNPEFASWLAERKLTRYNPQEMNRYFDGTLGAAIRDFLVKSGFEMEFVSKDVEPSNDIEYIHKRNGACHDIHHLVTGFGPNTVGEEALALADVTANSRFFTPELARYLSSAGIFVTTSGYSRVALHYHNVYPTFVEGMRQGIAAGLSLKMPLILVKWEDYLDWQLDDIAADLGFQRGPGSDWDWTSEAASG